MFVQIPQIVDQRDIPITIYHLIPSERLPVLLAPRLQVIFQARNVIDQQGHPVRGVCLIHAHCEINRSDVLASGNLGSGFYRRQLLCDLHLTKRCIQLLEFFLDAHSGKKYI